MNDLARRRAQQSEDSKMWSPLDALEDTIEELPRVEAALGVKVTKLAIHYIIEKPDGSATKRYVAAGLNVMEHLALLELGKDQVLREWRDG